MSDMRSLTRFLLWSAIVLALIIGALRAVALRWWRLPTNDPWLEASVEPSLRGGDLVLLWRLTAPRFGDLVICPEPNAPERVVLGRILGEEGDKIVIEASTVSVNGHYLPTERACQDPKVSLRHPRNGQPVEQACEQEVTGGALHQRASASGHPDPPPRVETQVPVGRVFLVSDNRLFPLDSRDFGPIERTSCRESIFYRLMGQDGFFDVSRRFTYIP